MLEDIAGGIMVTAPPRLTCAARLWGAMWRSIWLVHGVDAETRLRALRLCENLSLAPPLLVTAPSPCTAAGSPQAQKIMIGRQGNSRARRNLPRRIAGSKK